MKSRIVTVFIIAVFLILMTACGAPKPAAVNENGNGAAAGDKVESGDMKVFTPEELAKYDGKDGRPAYIAVDGKVYDVTNVPMWKGGVHQGRFQAGRDYTKEIKELSPHGTSKLKVLKVVGVLK